MSFQKIKYRKKTFHWPSLLLVTLAIQLWSAQMAKVDFRAMPSRALVIKQMIVSPSWAAYEDSQQDWGSVSQGEEIPAAEGEVLLSGISAISDLENLYLQTPVQSPPVSNKNLPVQPQYPVLNGIIISQAQPIIGEQNIAAQATAPAKSTALLSPSEPRIIAASVDGVEDSILVSQLRKEYLAAPEPGEGEVSFADRAQALVAAEIAYRQSNENQRIIPTSTGGGVLVASVPSMPKVNTSSNSLNMSSDRTSGTTRGSRVSNSTVEPPAAIAKVQNLEERSKPFTISGQFSIVGGLAFVPDIMAFEVVQYLYDIPVAQGIVWESEAKFEIVVKELKGRLALRLVDQDGRVLGEAELSLHKLEMPPKNQMKISNIVMAVVPTPIGATAEVVSAYSLGTDSQIPVAQAKVEIQGVNRAYKSNAEGRIDDPDMLPGSSYVMRAQRKNYWGSLIIGLSGERQILPMFPEKMTEALLGIMARSEGELRDLRSKGIVWGRVVKDGEPIAGAHVEMAGEQEHTPVYFNDAYLPDPNLEGTGRNGLFAFVGVIPGIHSIRPLIDGAPFPAKIIPVENQHVSHLELETGHSVSALIKVSSAPHRLKAAEARLRIVGTDIAYDINGESAVQWPKGSGLMMIEAEGEEGMEIVRLSLNRNTAGISIPMIPSNWLVQMATLKKVNLEGSKGVVVGFVNNKDFEVFLDDKEPYSLENVIYFDRNGEVLRGRGGVAGGGFALFNVPPGFRSVSVVPKGSDRVLSRTIIAEPAITNLIPEIGL